MKAQLLQESFALIAEEKEVFTHSFYSRLFSEYPQLRELFVQDIVIQEHSLAATLQAIVQVAAQEKDLQPILYKLGKRHEQYGVKGEHYPLLGKVLVETFSAFLGERFTPAMQQAWAEAYHFISIQMIAASADML